MSMAAARWLSWLERCPVQKGAGSITGWATYLGCRFDPWSGCGWVGQLNDGSLSPLSSLSKVDK